MLLDNDVREKLSQYLQLMENDVLIKVSVADDPASNQMSEFVRELADLSAKIHVKETALARVPSFSINKVNQDTGITFAGIPLGHEFTSLVLALLQTSGYPPKVDASLVDQIKNIKSTRHYAQKIIHHILHMQIRKIENFIHIYIKSLIINIGPNGHTSKAQKKLKRLQISYQIQNRF